MSSEHTAVERSSSVSVDFTSAMPSQATGETAVLASRDDDAAAARAPIPPPPAPAPKLPSAPDAAAMALAKRRPSSSSPASSLLINNRAPFGGADTIGGMTDEIGDDQSVLPPEVRLAGRLNQARLQRFKALLHGEGDDAAQHTKRRGEESDAADKVRDRWGGPDDTKHYVCYHTELGQGAYKTVYKGMDLDESVEVAWNEMKSQKLTSSELRRLDEEVKILASLQHPNVVRFMTTFFSSSNCRVFITELMTSGTLKQFLRKTGAPKLTVLQNWCKQILLGLKYLHERDVIHRDIKSDNIFIDGTKGEVKIGDLGLACTGRQGKAHSVIGTPEFMAPEMYKDEDYDHRVDIWAFGMTVLEMVTLEYPYAECQNAAQIYRKVSQGIKPAAFAMLETQTVKRDFVLHCICDLKSRASIKNLLRHELFNPAQPTAGQAFDRTYTTVELEGLRDDGTVDVLITKRNEGYRNQTKGNIGQGIQFNMDLSENPVDVVDNMIEEELIAEKDRQHLISMVKQVITEAEASIQKEKERGKKREEKETISADGGVTHATGSTSGVPGHSAIDSTSPGTSQPNEQRSNPTAATANSSLSTPSALKVPPPTPAQLQPTHRTQHGEPPPSYDGSAWQTPPRPTGERCRDCFGLTLKVNDLEAEVKRLKKEEARLKALLEQRNASQWSSTGHTKRTRCSSGTFNVHELPVQSQVDTSEGGAGTANLDGVSGDRAAETTSKTGTVPPPPSRDPSQNVMSVDLSTHAGSTRDVGGDCGVQRTLVSPAKLPAGLISPMAPEQSATSRVTRSDALRQPPLPLPDAGPTATSMGLQPFDPVSPMRQGNFPQDPLQEAAILTAPDTDASAPLAAIAADLNLIDDFDAGAAKAAKDAKLKLQMDKQLDGFELEPLAKPKLGS